MSVLGRGAIDQVGPSGVWQMSLPQTPGLPGQVLSALDGLGNTAWSTLAAPAAPGAPDTSVQYNKAGVFTGNANFTFNDVTLIVRAGNGIAVVQDPTILDPPVPIIDSAAGSLFKCTWNNDLFIGPGVAPAYDINHSSGENTFVGVRAGAALNQGQFNTGVGFTALASNTNGARNTAVGDGAGLSITTGSKNTLIGVNSGASVVTGDDNTCIGEGGGAGAAATGNTLVGSGNGVGSGGNNTVVGFTNPNISSGSRNTIIGAGANSGGNPTMTDSIIIGYGQIALGSFGLNIGGVIVCSDMSAPVPDIQVNGSLIANGGFVRLDGGTVAKSLWYLNSTADPSTHALFTATDYVGGNSYLLGNPDAWVFVKVGGSTYKMPVYA